jgi:thiamine biosynthesis lipoprotein
MTAITWPAWGTTASLSVAEPGALHAAERVARAVFADAERAADRRNPHAELHRLDRGAGRPVRVSRRLAALVAANVDAARRTGGLVDPTVGNAVVLIESRERGAAGPPPGRTPPGRTPPGRTPPGRTPPGRTPPGRDLSWAPVCGAMASPPARPAIGWQSIDLDGRYVTVPPHVLLDLSAIGKAATVEHAASVITRRLGIGVLVGLGGDLTAAGRAPDGGWRLPEVCGALDRLPSGAGIATVRRAIIDPRAGRVTDRVWATATVRCGPRDGGLVAAKALAVGAAVVGPAAPLWLDERGVRWDARSLVPSSRPSVRHDDRQASLLA